MTKNKGNDFWYSPDRVNKKMTHKTKVFAKDNLSQGKEKKDTQTKSKKSQLLYRKKKIKLKKKMEKKMP